MDKLSVSFSSFISEEKKAVKKSLIMAPNIVLPISKAASAKFVEDISGNSPSLAKLYSKCIIPLEAIIGEFLYNEWKKPLENYFDPKQNIAIGVVPGFDTFEGVLQRSGMFMKKLFPVHSWCCSAVLYDDHNIPSLTNNLEINSIVETIKLDDHERSDFNLFKIMDEIVFFNVENLSWEQIAVLRESKYFQDFTKSLQKLKSIEMQKPGGAYYKVLNDLFQFVGEAETNLSESIIKTIFCNIQIAPVNPLAIFDSIIQIQKTKDFSSRYGYLFFINEIRSKSKVNSNG